MIPTFMSNIPNPNGMLLPGKDTGKRKGATRIIQVKSPPCSPISCKKSLKVIPSEGISKDILVTVSEVLSFSESFIITSQPTFQYKISFDNFDLKKMINKNFSYLNKDYPYFNIFD
jgi:hypothetical protein